MPEKMKAICSFCVFEFFRRVMEGRVYICVRDVEEGGSRAWFGENEQFQSSEKRRIRQGDVMIVSCLKVSEDTTRANGEEVGEAGVIR